MRVRGIINLLVQLRIGHEVILDSFELKKLIHAMQLLIDIWPAALRNPIRRVGLQRNSTLRTSQQILPLVQIDSILTRKNSLSEQEREDELVLFKQRQTHVLIE